MQNNYLKTFNSKKDFMNYLAEKDREEEVSLDDITEPTDDELKELESEDGQE